MERPLDGAAAVEPAGDTVTVSPRAHQVVTLALSF
jgi:hypothetical protein